MSDHVTVEPDYTVHISLTQTPARSLMEILDTYVNMLGGPNPERELVTLADELADELAWALVRQARS